ncbi:MAG: PadR family transcriptional regulator [Actinomycetota bacterium]|jgi:DNA-binding PadR family transcriptional regulator|nr:PadR family transcriptional regulator [Actinomycetota bacterium]
MTGGKKSASFGHNEGTVTLILSSLAGGEKHGYSLVKDVEEFAGVHIAPGTLYEALSRLEKQKLIEPVESDDRRRPYRLTALGATVLDDRLRAQRRVANIGLKRLGRGWSIA